MKFAIITPWHRPEKRDEFLSAWGIKGYAPDFLFLQQDCTKAGCARTKNAGIRRAIDAGAEHIIVLDDDCYPAFGNGNPTTLEGLADAHIEALLPQDVPLFQPVTKPVSRGTPYFNRTVQLPVAASMGFWVDVGDYDAPGQLVHGARHPMEFRRCPVFGRYFPLCGMNLAFRPSSWPWCQFIDVPRFDDIWQGFLWQKHAYANHHCFNLNGPLVRHSRQSNVWQNLREEAVHLENNETLWQDIFMSRETEYEKLRKLLPV